MEPPHAPRHAASERTDVAPVVASWRERVAVALLLAAHLVLLLDGARRDAFTFDEPLYIMGGVNSWRTGNLNIASDMGQIPERLAALPLVLAGVQVPDMPQALQDADSWPLAHAVAYDSGLAPATVAFLARIPCSLLSVLLGWLVHRLARGLFGSTAALVSLTLFAFSPALLAHGRLATADLPVTLAMTAFAWLASRCLTRATPARVLASATTLGLACVSKMSGVLLLPVAAVIVIVHLAARAPMSWGSGRTNVARSLGARLGVIAALGAVHALVVVAVIWAFHGFREAPTRGPVPMSFPHQGWQGLPRTGVVGRSVAFAHDHQLLPEAWLFGFQYTELHSHERQAHAMGRWSVTSWRWFFPLAFVLKTPLATMLLGLLGLAALPLAWHRGRQATLQPLPREGLAPWARQPWGADLLALAPLLALLVVYWAVALRTPLAIGHRHLLPTLPATFVLAGAAASFPGARRVRLLVAGLTLAAALEGLTAHPFHIAWMNPLAGAPERRWTRLVDSSLDWGQDARRVAEFLADDAPRRGGRPAYLSWFGTSDPVREGAVAHVLPSFHPLKLIRSRELLAGGTYVISATMLVQVYGNFPGAWAAPYEEIWRHADSLAQPFLEADEGERRRLEAQQGEEYWSRLLDAHEQLRLARLCAWLRHRPADAVIGDGAVLAWRLTDAQVDEALHGPPVELVDEPVMPWAGTAMAAPR